MDSRTFRSSSSAVNRCAAGQQDFRQPSAGAANKTHHSFRSEQENSSYVPPFARGECYRPLYSQDIREDRHGHRSDGKVKSEPKQELPARASGIPYIKKSHESPAADHIVEYTREASQGNSPGAAKVLPKHFKQPLTCFYWATQGHCVKSDEQCYYCHYATGVVASAPVRIGNTSELVLLSSQNSC